MPNVKRKIKTLKKASIILLVPIPIVLFFCFKLSQRNFNLELELLAQSYVRQLEEQIDDLRDENKQALYDAQNCNQIQKDLLFEPSLREMLIIENGKIVCSSKRRAEDIRDGAVFSLPKQHLKTGEYLFGFVTGSGTMRNLLVVDTDQNNPQRSAISIVEQSYLSLQLAVNDDYRIKALQMTVAGKHLTATKTNKPTVFSVSAKSNYLDINIMLEPSDKFKRQELNLVLLIALPISLSLSLFLFLFLYWIETRGSLLEAVKKGICNDEFFLAYQPIVRSSDQQIEGVEALIRWQSPKLGNIEPNTFIPLAEKHGFINTITDFVLNKALSDWEEVNHKNKLHIAVNIPPSYLVEPDTLKKFRYYAQQFREQNLSLSIEITERQLLSKEGRNILFDIRNLGVDISIDDFGTGYTSLSVLQDIEFDYLKIDHCFTKTVGVESVNAPILKNIIGLAHDLNVSIVAEGIETQQQLDYLTTHNVQFLQGFYLYKPLTIEKLKELFAEEI